MSDKNPGSFRNRGFYCRLQQSQQLLVSSLPFGGTTILIIAGVGLDTLRQAAAQVRQFQYKGFLVPKPAPKPVPSEPIPVESE